MVINMKTGKIKFSNGEQDVSKIILGTCYFGTDISREVSFDMMDAYYNAGGRAFDTARVYGQNSDGLSVSEQTVGEWINSRGVRHEVTLITKGSHPPIGKMHTSRLSKECIHSDAAASLRDLGSDYIDIYFLHRDDEKLPVSEIMDALHELVETGSVRAIGASNWSLSRILEANRYAAENGKTPFTVSEIQWSLASCTSEAWGDDTLVCMTDCEYDEYIKSGIPVFAFSPQAKGLFSKYISGGRESLNKKIVDRFLTDNNLEKIEAVRKMSDETGLSPAALAIAYITCNRLSGFAVIGCSSCSQLDDSLTAAEIEIDSNSLIKTEVSLNDA